MNLLRPFQSSLVHVSFYCPICGPKILPVNAHGVIVKRAKPLIAREVAAAHARMHEEEKTSNGTNHA